jgi:glycosyltransferase involved in cell wall biosynthesis
MKISLIIPTYNRPEYLEKCLNSIKDTFLYEGSLIYIIDDGSADQKTIQLINDFEKKDCIVEKVFKIENKGTYDSMLTAYEYCFDRFEYVILIGSDIIVNNYFYDMMTYYYNLFPNNIISGFNTLTISELGKPRHPIIEDGGFYRVKETSGSACFGFNRKIYEDYFKETLINSMKRNMLCYDTNSTKKASNNGHHVICTVPSVVEHIGIESTMEHNNNPDISVDFQMNLDLLKKSDKIITVNMATYPKRRFSFKTCIESLLKIDKIDKIRVYLNEYKIVPYFLKNDKIEYVIGGEDLKDSGKFFWAGEYKNEYYFTLDDDLKIDEDYIDNHIESIKYWGDDVIISLHGKVLSENPKDFKDTKSYYHCLKDVENDSWINFPGTGVMMFDNLRYKISNDLFKHHGMTDLWIARFCQSHRIPCLVRSHKEGDIELIYKGSETLWNKQNDMLEFHREILKSIKKWTLYTK